MKHKLKSSSEHTQYMLLYQNVWFSKFYTLRKPMHQTNLANMRVVAEFNDDKAKTKRLCTAFVAFSNDLPYVQYLSDDTNIIITKSLDV